MWVSFPGDGPTFGLFVGEARTVHAAPPCARYTLGWDAGRAKRYFRGRGARVEVHETRDRGNVRVDTPTTGAPHA